MFAGEVGESEALLFAGELGQTSRWWGEGIEHTGRTVWCEVGWEGHL